MLAIAICVVATAVLGVQLFRPHGPQDLWPNRLKAMKAAAVVEEETDVPEEVGSAEEILEALKEEENNDDPA